MPTNNTTPTWREMIYRLIRQLKDIFSPMYPSEQEGMGARPYTGGTSFRVWAPHADNVFVTGSFNNWSREKHALAGEGNGYWSADIEDAITGDEYRYVIQNGNQHLLRVDPYARKIAKENGNGIICEICTPENGNPQNWMPQWNEMVIYELHVGTFGEGATDARGQFEHVIAKLPYLQYLGINAIEIMPVAEFAGDYSWGYNPAHPFAITQTYGGKESFRQLVKAAHDAGIAVIVDVVYNHFGPDDLSLWQFDGWQEDGKGGIYFYNDWRSTTPWADTRPDYGRPEVRQYLRDNALMWMDEFQVDGLRWDATAWIRNVYGHEGDQESDILEGWDLMRWVNDEIDRRRPGAMIIAEDLRGNEAITRSTADGGAGFDSQWDERFVHPVRAAITSVNDEDRDMQAVASAITATYNGDVFKRIIYTESHDEVANGQARVPEDIAPGTAGSWAAKKRSTLGAGLLFTSPGIPMIFQGQEFVESGWFEDTKSLDWQKAKDNGGIVKLYHDLVKLRRNCDGDNLGLTGQNTEILLADNDQKLLVFRRWEFGGPGDDVLVIANFSHQTLDQVAVPFPQNGLWNVRFNSDNVLYDPSFDGTPHHDIQVENGQTAVTVGPYSLLIYTLA